MKQLSLAGKAIVLLFTAALLVACSSNKEKEDEAAAAAAAAAAAKSAQGAATSAELAAAEEAAMAAGNVFYFDFDSANLTSASISAINAHIAVMQLNNENIRLEGHTDERGTREYNMALGERRANAVRDYMVANGISAFRIESISFGEERPIAFGSDESAWAQNRRVELKPQ